MATENRKLPRRPAAARLQPDEKVYKRGGSDLQNGWMGRHGTLYLTDRRILFAPTVLDTALGARRREFPLDGILEVERYPKHPDDLLPGAKRSRMIIHTADCGYELLVSDLDAWIDAIHLLYEHRAGQNPSAHRPEFVREGSTTQLLAELGDKMP